MDADSDNRLTNEPHLRDLIPVVSGSQLSSLSNLPPIPGSKIRNQSLAISKNQNNSMNQGKIAGGDTVSDVGRKKLLSLNTDQVENMSTIEL